MKKFSLANLNHVFQMIKDLFNIGYKQHEDHLTAIDNQIADIQEQQADTNAKFLNYTPLNSPELKGTPTAPTADTKASDTQLATTQFVQQEIDRRALEFEITVGSTDIALDKIEAVTSIIQEEDNSVYRLRDSEGNIITPATLTTHVVDPETKKSLPTLLDEANPHIITIDEYRSIEDKEYKIYYVAKNEEDKEKQKTWRMYLRLQLIGEFNVDGNITLPRFPMRFPFRFAKNIT